MATFPSQWTHPTESLLAGLSICVWHQMGGGLKDTRGAIRFLLSNGSMFSEMGHFNVLLTQVNMSSGAFVKFVKIVEF